MNRLHESAAYDWERWPESYWRATVAEVPRHPPLEGEARIDLAVVGAGYTGLSAALEAAERFGAGVTVLEAGQPGWGASGRNGGFCCMGGTKLSPAAIERAHGARVADAVHRFQRGAVDHVADVLERHGIDAEVTGEGEVCLAHRPSAMAGLAAGAEALSARFGLDTEVLGREALAERGFGPAGFAGGVLTSCGFGLHPLKYVLGLAAAATRAGVTIHGASPVSAIRREGRGWRLITPRGSLLADRVIVATNGYSSDDVPPALAARVLPVFSAILVTRPLTEAERAAQGWQSGIMAYDSRHLLHYFRLLPDGRFLFGARGGLRATPRAAARIRAELRRHFEALFPAWQHVDTPYHWSGLVALTHRLMPWIGPAPGAPGLFVALGYHGNGVAAGSLAGRYAARLACGESAPELPAPFRVPPPRYPLPGLRRLGIGLAYLGFALADGPVRRAG